MIVGSGQAHLQYNIGANEGPIGICGYKGWLRESAMDLEGWLTQEDCSKKNSTTKTQHLSFEQARSGREKRINAAVRKQTPTTLFFGAQQKKTPSLSWEGQARLTMGFFILFLIAGPRSSPTMISESKAGQGLDNV